MRDPHRAEAQPQESDIARFRSSRGQVTEAEAEPEPPALPPFVLPFPPLIHAERGFTLRPWGFGPGDAEALTAAWADPDVARWNRVPAQADLDAATRWIRGEERRRTSGTAVDLVIAELDRSERVLGEVGLVMVEPERRWCEVGYWLVPEARGSGKARAAMGMFAEWALRELPVDRLFARTDEANPKSARVVKHAGFVLGGTLDGGPQVWVRDREPGPS